MTTTCAVGPCDAPREPGSSYCPKHGPKESKSRPAARSPKAAAAQMVCPHCQTKGTVTTKEVKVKQGVSGGKATAAVLTAGFSILATGLSRKQKMTEAHCGNCGATWHFA